MIPLLFTEDEAAARLAICPRTLRKARQAGRLSYILIGRAVRYSLADLEAFIDSRRRKDQPCINPAPRPKAASRRRSGEIVPFTARGR